MTYEPTMKTKLPTWLNGQKIAILAVVVAVGEGVAVPTLGERPSGSSTW